MNLPFGKNGKFLFQLGYTPVVSDMKKIVQKTAALSFPKWALAVWDMDTATLYIKDIRQYIELSMQGDDTIDTRLEMFRHQREVLTQQIQQLQHTLETVEYKCWFYEAAKAAGTVDVPGAMTDADVPEQFRAIRQELRGQKMPNGEK